MYFLGSTARLHTQLSQPKSIILSQYSSLKTKLSSNDHLYESKGNIFEIVLLVAPPACGKVSLYSFIV